MQDKIKNMTNEEYLVFMDFLENLTEGDVRKIAREMLMDFRDVKLLLNAFDKLKN
jgi:hypothetical protein